MGKEQYIGVKSLYAEPANNDQGEPGYLVYLDKNSEHSTWMAKSSFDRIHMKLLNDEKRLTEEDLNVLVAKWFFRRLDKRSIIGVAILKSGFRVYATASCINPKPDDNTSKGVELCKHRLREKIWNHLGFLGQWAFNGLKHTELTEPIYTDITDLENMEF